MDPAAITALTELFRVGGPLAAIVGFVLWAQFQDRKRHGGGNIEHEVSELAKVVGDLRVAVARIEARLDSLKK